MTQTDDLVARLRMAAHWAISENDHFEPELGVEAAARLSELEADNARLREALSSVATCKNDGRCKSCSNIASTALGDKP